MAAELTSTEIRRSSEISTLEHLLKGDLDWIVMKCLEKDRQRRYETANAVAADITRHLKNEPIIARPPSAIYKFQKAWKRNRLFYTASTVVSLSIVSGLILTTIAFWKTTKAQEQTIAESVRADQVDQMLERLVLDSLPELLQKGNRQGAKDLIERADKLIATTLTNSPPTELRLRSYLMNTYADDLKDFEGAKRQADRVKFLLNHKVTDDQLKLSRERLDSLSISPRDWLRIEIARIDVSSKVVRESHENLDLTPLNWLLDEFKKRTPPANTSASFIEINKGWNYLLVSNPGLALHAGKQSWELLPDELKIKRPGYRSLNLQNNALLREAKQLFDEKGISLQ